MGTTNTKLLNVGTTFSVVALASLAYYYVIYGCPWVKGGRKEKRSYITGIVGLQNFGNTCYFNACIQALAACTLFCAWVERRNLLNSTNMKGRNGVTDSNGNSLTKSKCRVPFPVIAALRRAFALINTVAVEPEPGLSELIPSNLIRELTNHNIEAIRKKQMRKFVLNSHQEQDTYEAFEFILESIAVESSYINKVYHSSSAMTLTQDSSFFEDDEESQSSTSFCKLIKKPFGDSSENQMSNPRARKDSLSGDEFEFDEEDEPITSVSSFCKLKNASPRSSILNSSNYISRLIFGGGGGDASLNLTNPVKGKKSAMDWFGGSIVSRTEVMDYEIMQDTIMAQPVTFDGTLGMKLICMSCNKQNPPTLDKFNALTVTLPRDLMYHGMLDLEDLLLQSLKPTQVHEVYCEGCKKKFGTTTSSSFVRFTAIGKLPLTLCIHISRTEWCDDGTCIKRNEHVNFPLTLDMKKFKRISDLINQCPSKHGLPLPGMGPNSFPDTIPKSNSIYALKAVVCHSGGSAESGHFITYRQAACADSVNDGWYFVSDCHTAPVSLSHVLNSSAYLLFYEKRATSSYFPY